MAEFKEKHDGGAAFPRPDLYAQSGMSLRDYIAAHAMQALIVDCCPETAAREAYQYSDAMLA